MEKNVVLPAWIESSLHCLLISMMRLFYLLSLLTVFASNLSAQDYFAEIEALKARVEYLESRQSSEAVLDTPAEFDAVTEAGSGVVLADFRENESALSLRIGGYVKGDFIHDFDPIESKDNFDPVTIFTDGREGQNTRLHARQTRLNIDANTPTEFGDLKIFVEGDFFGERDTLRLRHAYGELGEWTVGQTWTTYTQIAALPTTLDFESPIAFVVARRAQIRWTKQLDEHFSISAAVEDPRVIFPREDELPQLDLRGEEREPLPDFVARIRYVGDDLQLQFAGILHTVGFQPRNDDVTTDTGYGLVWSGFWRLAENHKILTQTSFGDGVGGLMRCNRSRAQQSWRD